MEKIEIEVQGQKVLGEITGQSRLAIAVRITFPFQHLSSMHYLSPIAFGSPSYLGTEGEAAARWMLRDCYNLGVYLEENLPALQDAWRAYLEVEAALPRPDPCTKDAFGAFRRGLRAALRAGRVTHHEHQAELGKARQAIDAYEGQICMARWGFIDQNFPYEFCFADLDQQVVPILEGRVPLRAPTPE